MAFGSEVTGKLGIDTASVPADLARAKAAMDKFGKETEKGAEKTGSNAGAKLGEALGHKLTNMKHLAGVLSSALGLNLEKIADGIAAAYVGGSKEAWKQMGELADQNLAIIEKKIEAAMTPKGVQEKIKKDLARAAQEAQGAGKGLTGTEQTISMLEVQNPLLGKMAEWMGIIRSEADRKVEIGKAELKLNEADLRVIEQKKAVEESHKKLKEYEDNLALKNLNSTELLAELDRQKAMTQDQITSGKLSELEIDEKKKHLHELDGQLDAERLRMQQVELDKAKELARLQDSYGEAKRKMAQDEEDLENARKDRGKSTVDELAELKPGKTSREFGEDTRVDTFGLSAEAAQAKVTANEVKRMQKQAEALRTQGDVGGANALFDQIGAKKQSLVDSGFAKSTEGDEFKKMAETIHKDNTQIQKILADIAEVAKGKLKNQ